MARHCCKMCILLMPSLATMCLLVYCLLSESWISIDQPRLDNLTRLFDSDYQNYLSQVNLIQKSKAPSSAESQTDSYEDDQDDLMYNDESVQSENLFKQAGASSKQTVKKAQPNYVYITKLWPFRKYKSLYSDCVEYKKLNLRLSVSYLTSSHKEPIIGDIHYYENNITSQESCNEKSGNIKCLFTQQCRSGKSCDGVVDCEDQSDEQMCDDKRTCRFNDISGFKCDNRCWQYWNKCDHVPHCFDLSDELSNDCLNNYAQLTGQSPNDSSTFSSFLLKTNNDLLSFTFGHNFYDHKSKCFRTYFNFKNPKQINKDSLKYLKQQLADNIQEMNYLNFHLQLIYDLCFLASLIFTLLALLSLMFMICFKKMCFQCPFWFYGFFQIISWLSCLFGLMTFLYQFYTNKQKSLDPLVQIPIENELIRLNMGLMQIEKLGLTFWLAVGAMSSSFLASFLSCLVCCSLPSSRHEDKEYKIMQLPTYS